VLHSEPLFDRSGWYAALRRRADVPYPEALRRAVVTRNHPLLRDTLSSYLAQIERAVARRDAPSVNHRVAALLASFFDVLFALNRVPHPGEKRLLARVEALCGLRPPRLGEQVAALLAVVARCRIGYSPRRALDGLDALLAAEDSPAGEGVSAIARSGCHGLPGAGSGARRKRRRHAQRHQAHRRTQTSTMGPRAPGRWRGGGGAG
jgi:hypothetical protein